MTSAATFKSGASFLSIGNLALLLLFYIPFSGLPNFFNSINGIFIHRGTGPLHSNLYLLLTRDILVLICIGVYFIAFIKNKWPVPRIPGFLLLLTTASFSVFLAAYKVSFPISMAALRTYEYFPMIAIFYGCTRRYQNFSLKFEKMILFVSVFEFVACCFQTVYMPYYEGLTFFGARVIGTFNNPNTIGAMAAFSSYVFLFLSKQTFKVRTFALCINTLTLLMAGSRVAILIFAVLVSIFLLWKTKPKYRLIVVGFALMTFSSLTIMVGHLAGRGAIPPLHEDPRVQIFLSTMDSLSVGEFLFGVAGGVRSNTVILLAAKLPQYFSAPPEFTELAESGVISMILQIGLIGTIIFYGAMFCLAVKTKGPGIILFILLCMLSLSNVWLEMYPLNLLIFATFGVLLGKIAKTVKKHPDPLSVQRRIYGESVSFASRTVGAS